MPNKLRSILLALFLAAATALAAGCGGSSGPDPSIARDQAAVLSAKINEINANVDVGSCLVASDKTDELIADIHALPSSVDDQVTQALENGANNLKLLLADPSQCQGRTTTTETTTPSTTESTTQSTTTTRTRPSTTTTTPTQTQQQTTTTQTQTTPTPTTGGSGGIGPGGL